MRISSIDKPFKTHVICIDFKTLTILETNMMSRLMCYHVNHKPHTHKSHTDIYFKFDLFCVIHFYLLRNPGLA